MMYVVTRIGPSGGVVATRHGELQDAVDEVMYLHSRGITGINLNSLPDVTFTPDSDDSGD